MSGLIVATGTYWMVKRLLGLVTSAQLAMAGKTMRATTVKDQLFVGKPRRWERF
jgi:enoyl-CoA hydratase/carnithine racemase